MISETELPLCSLLEDVLYIRYFVTGVLTTQNFSVDSLTPYEPSIVLHSLPNQSSVYKLNSYTNF